MRVAVFILASIFLSACSSQEADGVDKKESNDTATSNLTPPEDKAEPTIPTSKFQCDAYLSGADIEKACGTAGISLTNEERRPESHGVACDRGNTTQRADFGQIRFLIEALAGPSIELTEKPELKTYRGSPVDKMITHTIGMVKGNYELTVASSSTKDHKAPCNPEELQTLFASFANKVPTVGTARLVNPLCAKAITATHLKSTCGQQFELERKFGDGWKGNPCNRSGSGLNFRVSQHEDPASARRAEDVIARRKDSGPGFKTVQSSGNYVIQISALDGSACASAAKVKALAAIAATTLN